MSVEAKSNHTTETGVEGGDIPLAEPSGTAARSEELHDPPHSIFNQREKVWVSTLAAIGAMFSTLTSYIYFPAIVPMSKDLGVSVSLINLTITSYMIVAGVAPAFMGDLADQGGRRPAYILMFVLVLASNVGLALQDSYAALVVLRVVQSAGASGSYGAAYGIVADITTVQERGSFVGSLIFFTNAAPCFGPVIAGALTQSFDWRAIFWFLVILSGVYLLMVTLSLPETQRKLVGNGSIPAKGVHRSAFDYMIKDRIESQSAGALVEYPKRQHRFPNPFTCVSMLFRKGNFLVILVGSITYTVKMTLQTSLSAQCIEVYDLTQLQAGLIYLPSGIGGALASYSTGKFLDKNRQRVSKGLGRDEKNHREVNISDFPIEKVRLVGVYTLIGLSASSTAGYGVSLLKRSHISVPLFMQFISGAATSSIFTICGTLLTDMNPHSSATVQASYNIVRCIGAGAAIASQQPLANVAGTGWCFGVFSVIMLSAVPPVLVLKKYGMGWRQGVNAVSTSQE